MNAIDRKLRNALFNGNPDIDARIDHGIELYRKGTVAIRVVDGNGRDVDTATVTLRQTRHEFLFGANGFLIGQLEGERADVHDQAFARLFNLVVVPFYWSDLEPEDGSPRFGLEAPNIWRRPSPDVVLEFCNRHGITPKGHPLMWHCFVPGWLRGSPEEIMARWERRFREIAERYGERIRIWDVVNESLAFNPNSHWAAAKKMPPNPTEFAFDLAAKHFPESCLLYYNDYLCWHPLRGVCTPAYLLVKNLLLQGKKVDGFGLQYHLFADNGHPRQNDPSYWADDWANGKLNADVIYEALDLYQGLGLPLDISETTITAHPMLGKARLEFQADAAERLYRMWFAHPAVKSIIYWNMMDSAASCGNENDYQGGLLNNDDTLTPKPVYERLSHLINSEWRTHGSVECVTGKPCCFRGFYGTYDATVTLANGLTTCSEIHIGKGRPRNITLRV